VSKARILAIVLVVIFVASAGFLAQRIVSAENPKPVSADELLALIAGNALPQDIVHKVSQDGISFRPDDAFKAQLNDIGADASIIAAVNAAKLGPEAESLDSAHREVLQHYVNAAHKMKAKDYQGASDELGEVVKSSFDVVDPGFVLGEVFRLENEFYESAATYGAVLARDSNYPGAHAKLSYIEIKLEDDESGLRQAKQALAEYADDAEGHKDACLAMEGLKEYESAAAECLEALRLFPNYPNAHLDLGIIYEDEGKLDDTIAEMKKALALEPGDALNLYDLGYAYDQKGDLPSAISFYRQAVAADPTWFNPRQNLAASLEQTGDYADSVAEYREMEKIFPDSAVCHFCTGIAVLWSGDMDGAEAEFRKAIQLDPSDPDPHVYIARIRLQQKRYDEALKEDQIAEQLDANSFDAHNGAGMVLLAESDFAKAAAEFKQAEDLKPSDASVHDQYGQALLNEGKTTDAIQEFKQASLLDPTMVPAAIHLAHAYEQTGDWADAMAEYHKTALQQAGIDIRMQRWRGSEFDPEKEYEGAQGRFNDYIASLKASGNAAQATALEAQIANMQKSKGLSDQLNALMQAGVQAYQQRKFEEGFQDFKQAVDIARQMQPHDARLAAALDYLGNGYMAHDFASADTSFEEELKVDTELYGPNSPNLDLPLESLGNSAMIQKNYAAAEKYYFEVVDLTSRAYGESNDQVAMKLVSATRPLLVQKQFDKAEPYLLRAEHIEESTYGEDSGPVEYPLASLCWMYDQWNKPDKAEPCYEHYVRSVEKQFGVNSPKIISVLVAESAALRKLGRASDADVVDKRVAALRSATMRAN